MATKTKPLTAEQKQALARMRQRLGGLNENKLKRHKDLLAIRKAIRGALLRGPLTAPALAQVLDRPVQEVFWHLTGMRRYALARDAGEADGYVLYALNTEPAAK